MLCLAALASVALTASRGVGQEAKQSVMVQNAAGKTMYVIAAQAPAPVAVPVTAPTVVHADDCGCQEIGVAPAVAAAGYCDCQECADQRGKLAQTLSRIRTAPAPCDCTGDACCDGCEFTCDGDCFEPREKRVTLQENLANTANYNCRVNGSYKYPVPKQYTYFWPGIYSQKRMTDYVSPYQGIRLESPATVFGEK